MSCLSGGSLQLSLDFTFIIAFQSQHTNRFKNRVIFQIAQLLLVWVTLFPSVYPKMEPELCNTCH